MATTWYLKVKTLNDEHVVDLGGSSAVARAILEQAKGRMEETGAVTIAGSLVVNASDIVSITLQRKRIRRLTASPLKSTRTTSSHLSQPG